jgi:hypothetical protein
MRISIFELGRGKDDQKRLLPAAAVVWETEKKGEE